ncbi:MAG: GNAT family protein, partial [Pseudomonadota bacterium]
NDLKLHRIEALCMPENYSSLAVLRKNNFYNEGVARQILRIKGTWKDHMRYVLLSDAWHQNNIIQSR